MIVAQPSMLAATGARAKCVQRAAALADRVGMAP